MDNKILVTRSSMPTIDEYIEEIRSIWDSHWLTNMGEKHKKLQAELEEYLRIPHVTLYTNGHLALKPFVEQHIHLPTHLHGSNKFPFLQHLLLEEVLDNLPL